MKAASIKNYLFYYILGYFFGIVLLAYPFLFPNEVDGWDPYWPRILVGGYVIGFTFLSPFVKAIRKYYWQHIYVFSITASVWLTVLVFTNEVKLDYAFFQLLSVLMTAAVFQSLRLLWTFTAAILLLSGFLIWIPEDPQFSPYAILVAELVAMLGVGFIRRSQILERNLQVQRKLKKEARNKELLMLESQTLVEMSKKVGGTEEEVDEAIQTMALRAIQTLGANEVSVWLLYRKGSLTRCTHDITLKEEQIFTGTEFSTKHLSHFLEGIRNIRVTDAWSLDNRDARAEWEALLPGFVKSHSLWVPMRLSGNLKGFFMIQDSDRKQDWTNAEIRFAGALGDTGSMLLEGSKRRRVEEELRNRNFELDSFVYRASHDLKAPLNSMMGLLALVNEKGLGTESQTYIQLMEKSVVKLNTFIQNLSEFSRVTRLELAEEEIDFNAMIEEIFEGLRYMEGNERLKKEVVQTGSGQVLGDKFHLEIILGNLLSNAIKYQDYKKDNPYVKVQIDIQEAETKIVISDNGIGIPAKYKDKMFGLFFRASTQAFGSGLGLYIIRNAVTKLGGSIAFDSEEGQGTTFTVKLPGVRKGSGAPALEKEVDSMRA